MLPLLDSRDVFVRAVRVDAAGRRSVVVDNDTDMELCFERVECRCIFFFQAEDGIRDKLVTGVQVCSSDLFYGVSVGSGSVLGLGDTKLRIINPGQPWGGNTAGVFVSDGGTLTAGANLVISGSHGQGVFVSNNSHASLAGSSITGSSHGGLVVTNLSTVAVGTGTNPLTQISGNGTDLFCDSRSLITGGANIANATTVQCGNLLAGDTVPVP